MSYKKFDKIQCYLAIVAVVCIIIEFWFLRFFYGMYAHNGAEMSLIVRSIFLPGVIWLFFLCGAIVAWFKKWRWFVWAPLLLTYPGITDQLDALLMVTATVGQWYWVVKLNALSKIVFYGLSVYGIYLYMQRQK